MLSNKTQIWMINQKGNSALGFPLTSCGLKKKKKTQNFTP